MTSLSPCLGTAHIYMQTGPVKITTVWKFMPDHIPNGGGGPLGQHVVAVLGHHHRLNNNKRFIIIKSMGMNRKRMNT